MKTLIIFLVFVLLVIKYVVNSPNKILYEDDECKLSGNKTGICVRLSLCPAAQELFKQHIYPKNCGFVRDIPIVCCSKIENRITRLANQKCKEYLDSPSEIDDYDESNDEAENTENDPSFIETMDATTKEYEFDLANFNSSLLLEEEDGQFSITAIGGTDAYLGEFPHMAALGYTSGENKIWLCGGSLISEEYVLTAAHCLISFEYGQAQWVRLGVVKLKFRSKLSSGMDYKIIRLIPHPFYANPSKYHDIGLVQLDRLVKIGGITGVMPICLFTNEKIPEGLEYTATGWGLTKVNGNRSEILQKVKVDLYKEEECSSVYDDTTSKRQLKYGIMHNQQICLGGKSVEMDTCQGDSGGPLQINVIFLEDLTSIDYLIGITSFGKSCGTQTVPGIYTKVSFYVPWIENIVWPNEK